LALAPVFEAKIYVKSRRHQHEGNNFQLAVLVALDLFAALAAFERAGVAASRLLM
jgi:hypothetical protein